MAQTLLHLADLPAGIEAPAQRPARNTVPASVKLQGGEIIRNPWQDAAGNLVSTLDQAPEAPACPTDEIIEGEIVDITDQLAPAPESAGSIVPAGTVITPPAPTPETQRGGYLLPQQTYATAQDGVRVFMFDGHPVRTGGDPKNPWFCVIDVLKAIDDKPRPGKKYNVTDAVQGLDAEELVLIELFDPNGKQRDTTCVFDTGLWFLIGNSRKKSAGKFKAWVRKEVLKKVNDEGSFFLPGIQPTGTNLAESAMVNVLAQIGKGVEVAVARLGDHESQLTIHGSQIRDHGSQISNLGSQFTIVDERVLRIEAETDRLKLNLADIETEFIRNGGRLRERPVDAEPEGGSPGIRANEQYLAVDAFRLRHYPSGFLASGLTMDNHRFGIRASQLCRQRGIKVEYWFCGNGDARCYPVSILWEVANECRRSVDPASPGNVALAS